MNRNVKIWLVKWFPILANVNLLVILLFSLYGVEVKGVTAYLFGVSIMPALIVWCESKELYFCSWHRILLINVYIYAILHMMQRAGVQFSYYFYVALTSVIVCLALATFKYFKYGCFKTDAKSLIQDGKRAKMRGVRENERSGAEHTTSGND
jgi:hypothetical protein